MNEWQWQNNICKKKGYYKLQMAIKLWNLKQNIMQLLLRGEKNDENRVIKWKNEWREK